MKAIVDDSLRNFSSGKGASQKIKRLRDIANVERDTVDSDRTRHYAGSSKPPLCSHRPAVAAKPRTVLVSATTRKRREPSRDDAAYAP